MFGKLDVGQFSLKEDNSTSLRANVVQRLRTELIDMGFDSMMIDELIGKGQLNKVFIPFQIRKNIIIIIIIIIIMIIQTRPN